MATEVNQNYFAWSQEESSTQDISQGESQMFGHGSISFGRFDLESLEWEKWSVFTNDRRHEEFGKFNGLVAKKKAYFEEYFKRIRELKALQQQNQQTELNLEYSGDGSDSSQMGEDEPAADHGAPTGSGTLDDSTERTAAATTFEHEMECYDDHENGNLVNEIFASTHSSLVGGLQQIGKQVRGNVSGRIDMTQNANPGQDDMAHETMMTPKRTIEKDSWIGQVSKITPKTVKMTSSHVPDHTMVNKGPGSGKTSVINQMAKRENILSLRRPREVSCDLVDTTGRSGNTGLRRPSSAASQRPCTRKRQPITRDASRKPTDVTNPWRPSTSDRRPVTRESALKHVNNATPHRPSTADRQPITKESARKQSNIATPRRPSTANRRPITKESAPKLSSIATPCRPSTADRRPITKELAPNQSNNARSHRPSTGERRPATRDMSTKHVGIVTSCRPSTAKQRPATREGVHKHADVVTLCRPSTAERRSIARDVAPKHGIVASPCRPSTAERRPIARDVALKHGIVASPCRPSIAERRPIARDVAPKHAIVTSPCRPSTAETRPIARDVAPKYVLPHRPSTAERRPITRETARKQANVTSSRWPLTPDRFLTKKSDISTPRRTSTGEGRPITNNDTLKSDPKTPIRLGATLNNSKGAMVTGVTPQKAITPNLVKNSKPENISYAKERVGLQVDGKQKSSSFNLPPRKMLISNVRDDRVLENFRKPNNEGFQESVRAQAFASHNVTPLQTGSVKTRAPVPPPPPPPPRRPSCAKRKPNVNNSPVGGRKPKASTPHWQ